MKAKKCPYCGYEWKPRVASPRSCPRCKRYFKHKPIKLGSQTKHIYKEDEALLQVSQILKEEAQNRTKAEKNKKTPRLILTQELDKNPPNTAPASRGKKLKIHHPLSYILLR